VLSSHRIVIVQLIIDQLDRDGEWYYHQLVENDRLKQVASVGLVGCLLVVEQMIRGQLIVDLLVALLVDRLVTRTYRLVVMIMEYHHLQIRCHYLQIDYLHHGTNRLESDRQAMH
jgi:hypothetical protein